LNKTEVSVTLARLRAANWDEVWAAWCPTCHQECMPMPRGTCAFCDTSLIGQPTREPHEPPLEEGWPLTTRVTRVLTKAA
jgi:hypothetical protein